MWKVSSILRLKKDAVFTLLGAQGICVVFGWREIFPIQSLRRDRVGQMKGLQPSGSGERRECWLCKKLDGVALLIAHPSNATSPLCTVGWIARATYFVFGKPGPTAVTVEPILPNFKCTKPV